MLFSWLLNISYLMLCWVIFGSALSFSFCLIVGIFASQAQCRLVFDLQGTL